MNFGLGDSTLAHTAEERVDAASIVAVHDVLASLLAGWRRPGGAGVRAAAAR
ncbi:MAG: hypothetical protein R2749_24930 [Acidimicrobiales bacterium]